MTLPQRPQFSLKLLRKQSVQYGLLSRGTKAFLSSEVWQLAQTKQAGCRFFSIARSMRSVAGLPHASQMDCACWRLRGIMSLTMTREPQPQSAVVIGCFSTLAIFAAAALALACVKQKSCLPTG